MYVFHFIYLISVRISKCFTQYFGVTNDMSWCLQYIRLCYHYSNAYNYVRNIPTSSDWIAISLNETNAFEVSTKTKIKSVTHTTSETESRTQDTVLGSFSTKIQ